MIHTIKYDTSPLYKQAGYYSGKVQSTLVGISTSLSCLLSARYIIVCAEDILHCLMAEYEMSTTTPYRTTKAENSFRDSWHARITPAIGD